MSGRARVPPRRDPRRPLAATSAGRRRASADAAASRRSRRGPAPEALAHGRRRRRPAVAAVGSPPSSPACGSRRAAVALRQLVGEPRRPERGAVAPRRRHLPDQPAAPLAAGETRTVTIETEKGDIVIKVDGALSPIAAGNFVALAACHFYDGVVFHRSSRLRDPGRDAVRHPGRRSDGSGTGGPGYTIQDEPVDDDVQARHRRDGPDASSPNTQGSQFFIVLDDEAGALLEQRQHLRDLRRGDVRHGRRRRDRRPRPTRESPDEPGRRSTHGHRREPVTSSARRTPSPTTPAPEGGHDP